jgi:L-gulonate 5-dehydrogenase
LQVLGVHTDGAFASQIVVPESNAYSVPQDMDWNTAVMVEPFSIGANICNKTGIGEGDRVLVVGSGIIGNTVLLTAKMLGAQVIMCDIDDSKLMRAESLGANHTMNTRNTPLDQEIDRITENDGVTVVIDAACIPSMFQTLLECTAPGGRIGILGFSKEFSKVNQFEITRKELMIFGSRLNNRMFPQVIKTFSTGQINPQLLIERVVSIDTVKEVLEEVERTGIMNGKTIFKVK